LASGGITYRSKLSINWIIGGASKAKKLEEQFNQWLVTLEEEFANWFAQKMSSFFNQLCGGTAMVPTIALAAVLVDKQRHRKNRK